MILITPIIFLMLFWIFKRILLELPPTYLILKAINTIALQQTAQNGNTKFLKQGMLTCSVTCLQRLHFHLYEVQMWEAGTFPERVISKHVFPLLQVTCKSHSNIPWSVCHDIIETL